ncbi:MAG: helix-turn-helix domain-containing protein [Burkholderiaceae bacterium]|nr:helix-turn-helix domain-containing protein [Burkholderiaceae bacterium]
MNPAGAIEQPRVTVVEITDPTDANAGIELMDLDAVQLQSTPFRARRTIVRLDASTVAFHATNLRIRTRTFVRKDLVGYVAFGARARGTVNGLQVRPGLILAAEPGVKATFVTDAGWESITFLLSPADIGSRLHQRQREGRFRLPQGGEALQVSAETGRGLFDWGKRLVDLAERHSSLFDERNSERCAAEAELFETLLAALGAANDFEPDRGDRTRQAYSQIVKVVEDHALAQTGERLSVTDLCRVAGVSERTLEYAFKELLGLTPQGYLTRLRLNRVRRALLAGARSASTMPIDAVRQVWRLAPARRCGNGGEQR